MTRPGPSPLVAPTISGGTQVRVGSLTFGVPAGSIVRQGNDRTTVYLLIPGDDGGDVHVLREHDGRVVEVLTTPALAASLRARAFR